MEFVMQKNIDRAWDIIPTAGKFTGQVVATAEGANLCGARFTGDKVIGAIKATWGLVILMEEIYTDQDTFRGLQLGKSFDSSPSEQVVCDRDGFKDSFTLRFLNGARRVMLLGSTIYTKGQY